MSSELKVIDLTPNCDMVYRSEDEIYYIIKDGENDGVTFTILDFKLKSDGGKIKCKYNPVIVTNSFNADIENIYSEIEEIINAKINLYLDKIQ